MCTPRRAEAHPPLSSTHGGNTPQPSRERPTRRASHMRRPVGMRVPRGVTTLRRVPHSRRGTRRGLRQPVHKVVSETEPISHTIISIRPPEGGPKPAAGLVTSESRRVSSCKTNREGQACRTQVRTRVSATPHVSHRPDKHGSSMAERVAPYGHHGPVRVSAPRVSLSHGGGRRTSAHLKNKIVPREGGRRG